MNIFWNKKGSLETEGLDILGLRNIDQHIEKDWVAGITTLSYRAKYLSMLAWGLVECYKSMPGKEESKEYNREHFDNFFSRLEYIILISSIYFDKTKFRLLGARIHSKSVREFFEKGKISIPEGKVMGIVNAYLVPAMLFGIVGRSNIESLNIQVTPRGKLLHDVIDKQLKESRLKSLIINGGLLKIDYLDKEALFFAASNIINNSEERSLLHEAVTTPPITNDIYVEQYEKFKGTINLLKTFGKESSDAEVIIQLNYNHYLDQHGLNLPNHISAWAEYEVRRNVHSALEMLLVEFTKELSIQGPSTFDSIIDSWANTKGQGELLQLLCDKFEDPFVAKLSVFMDYIRKNKTLSEYKNYGDGIDAVFGALIKLFKTYHKTQHLFDNKTIENRNSYLEKTFSLISASENDTVLVFLHEIYKHIIIPAHLETTFRKMGAGAKCSLRFYMDNGVLNPTNIGLDTMAGKSNTRLYNVISILSDIGVVEKDEKSIKVIGEF